MTALQRGLDCLPFRELPADMSSPTPRDSILGLTVPFHMLKLSETSTRQSRELVSALRRIKEKTRELSNSQKSTHSRRVSEGAGIKSDRSLNESSQIDIGRIRERVEKMRDIKSEIGNLMNKIDNASKKIQDSIKTPSNYTVL
jgi:Spy/CpxP family protein refolding chaperone